jgi:hypothetical protein
MRRLAAFGGHGSANPHCPQAGMYRMNLRYSYRYEEGPVAKGDQASLLGCIAFLHPVAFGDRVKGIAI